MKGIKKDAEGDLLESIRKGDEKAFCFIYNKYVDMLFCYGMKIIRNEKTVEEAIQILFTDFYLKRGTIAIQKSVHSYLCVWLRRIIYKISYSNIELVDLKSANLLGYQFGFEIDAETALIGIESRNEVQQRINNGLSKLLSPQQREVVYLKYYQNLSNIEISRILGLNSQVVRNISCRALNKLREDFLRQSKVICNES